MNLDQATIARLAEHLENCELEARDTPKITDEYPDMDFEDAYAIQDVIRARKIARGHKIVGLKAGLTSHAKMKQMGVTEPVFGFMADYYTVPEGGEVKVSELIHPKVEPEIAFVTRRPLKGPGCHIGAVLAATDFVLPGIEVIDSRYRDFKFDLGDVIADNSSSSGFVIGPPSAPGTDIANLGIVLTVDGRVAETGSSAAILGHPLRALVAAARMVAQAGEELRPGDIVLAGAATAAVPVAPGQRIELQVQTLGTVALSVGD